VELTEGQAYFEVAHKKEPFSVRVHGAVIEDLGTAFNVNSYPDQQGVSATLLEGSIKVVSGNEAKTLRPGEQAHISNEGNVSLNTDVETDDVVAWKDGRFQFSGVAFPTVLQYLSRWYDVDVVDKTGITQRLVLTVPREQTNRIHYKIEGRTLYLE
jgi:transmembrane sensor